MGVAVLGMAVAYLLLVAFGALGALLVLLWLFRDQPGTTEKIEGKRSAEHFGSEGTHSTSVDPERWEDEAA